MATDGRDNGKAERERELALSDAELVVREEGATLEELTDSLDRLQQLLQRVEQRQLEPDDWALLRAVVDLEMK
jgi:hypothetical protein